MSEHIEVCSCNDINVEKVEEIRGSMEPDEKLYELAELFKAFGDSTRIKILSVLFKEELCVCDIAEVLNMKQPAISHQLRVLKKERLVKFRREGKMVYYSLDDDHVEAIFNQGISHILHR